MSPQEIIALDVGGRRIGVARANTVARLPEPLTQIDRTQYETIQKIAVYLKKFGPDLLVIGLPKNLSGEATDQTKNIQDFYMELSKKLNDLPIKLVDETLSTVEAAKWNKKYPEASEDSLAACIILERYLSTSEAES